MLACSELSHTNPMLEKYTSKKIGTNKNTEIATTQNISNFIFHSILSSVFALVCKSKVCYFF